MIGVTQKPLVSLGMTVMFLQEKFKELIYIGRINLTSATATAMIGRKQVVYWHASSRFKKQSWNDFSALTLLIAF